MSAQKYDLIIAGAGMVGACAALALARKGMHIALLEASHTAAKQCNDDDYDLRVSAISPRSQQILQQLGIWSLLDASRVCNYEQMFIWHQNGSASVGFDAVDLAREHLGAIVENRQIQQALQLACQQSGIDWYRPDHIEALLQNTEQGVAVRLSSGSCLESELLIAADGRHSPTRELAGIEVLQGDYDQTAFVANVTTTKPHQHTAWQRFLTTGPLAFLPLSNGQSSIVWSCDNEFAEQIKQFSDKQFCDALSEAFELKLGRINDTSQRLSFPLAWHDCERWLQKRVLLIGDAAHSVHPLAGQGVNLGFSDVDLLSKLLDEGSKGWNQKQLRRYERQRKSETWVASKSFSGLKWLYGLDNPTLSGIRDLGMRALNKNPVMKRELMRRAMHNMA